MRYIACHKPCFVLSSFTHVERGAPAATAAAPKRTLSDLGLPPRVYAAGRLDYDSEGLLLLTDDGAFAHRITDPRHRLQKTYLAQVEGVPGDDALQRLRGGLRIRDYVTRPCEARVLPEPPTLPPRDKPITPHGPTAWLEIKLSEGRNRQVRHMTAAVGLPTLRLVRFAIGPVTLAGLAPGAWRDLTREDVQMLARG